MDVSWNLNGEDKFANARCLDISVGGLCLEIGEPIPERTSLGLRADQIDFIGKAAVRHIQRQGAKYNLGLELIWDTSDAPVAC